MNYRRFSLIALFLIVPIIAAGCAGSLGSSSTTGTGSLAVYLTDAPDDDLKEVWVTITGVQAHRDGKWHVVRDLTENPVEIDLLTLRFDQTLLGEATLKAGAYTQLRLIVDDSSAAKSYVVHADDSVTYLKVPSGAQTGLKIHHNFVVPVGGTVELVMDVNVLDFVHKAGESGKYIINPTAIRVVERTASGIITGQVLGQATEEDDPAPIGDRQVVISVRNSADEVVAETLAMAEESGAFQVNAVPEGVYTVVVEADNEGAEVAYESQTFTDVSVVAGGETALNSGDPIVLVPVEPTTP